MAEESKTPDPVERTHKMYEVATRQDLDTLMRFFAADAVWDMSNAGLGSFEGATAMEGFFQDWWSNWEDHHHYVDEVFDLGHGVVCVDLREDGRLVGSDGHVEQRSGWVLLWVHGVVESAKAYFDIDEARAAAERLAEERG